MGREIGAVNERTQELRQLYNNITKFIIDSKW